MGHYADAKLLLIEGQIAKILAQLNQVLTIVGASATREATIMSAIDDLTANLAKLDAAVDAHDVAVQAEIKALLDALAAGNLTAVKAAADNIATLSTKITDETSALVASVPPPARPAA